VSSDPRQTKPSEGERNQLRLSMVTTFRCVQILNRTNDVDEKHFDHFELAALLRVLRFGPAAASATYRYSGRAEDLPLGSAGVALAVEAEDGGGMGCVTFLKLLLEHFVAKVREFKTDGEKPLIALIRDLMICPLFRLSLARKRKKIPTV